MTRGRYPTFYALTFWGSDNQAATKNIAAAGTIVGSGAAPTAMQVNLIPASTSNDLHYGWSGVLMPMCHLIPAQ